MEPSGGVISNKVKNKIFNDVISVCLKIIILFKGSTKTRIVKKSLHKKYK